ncbi:hypothetical protein [Carnimonas bestiolae]|uniref:hypothetical protein n=1 Tax=Carnimonas bestiolae TaxID=3402172 RepID=UPI003EDC220A
MPLTEDELAKLRQHALPMRGDLSSELITNAYQIIRSAFNGDSDPNFFIDADSLALDFKKLFEQASDEDKQEFKKMAKITPQKFRDGDYNLTQKLINVVANEVPEVTIVVKHNHFTSEQCITMAELYLGAKTDETNFIDIKSVVDKLNKMKWSRRQTRSEEQSGVSVLGTISESLLKIAMDKLLDETTLFQTSNREVQSYGDFVLICLPNNLWLSVKSNFARERLLASGYTTDIIGAGFFTDEGEFTTKGKLRNFQRVGFLAMYIPDVAVTDQQRANNTSTYQLALDVYKNRGEEEPRNINGTPFIRPLSSLQSDIEKLKKMPIHNRTTINL